MKKIIIIGATSGIGLEVARCYLKDGWQVGVAGRREEELEKIRLSAPGQVCTQTIDVTREDAPFSLEQLITKMGGMDVFLLSSGIGKQNLSLLSGCFGPIGAHEQATHFLHRHPSRICRHPSVER